MTSRTMPNTAPSAVPFTSSSPAAAGGSAVPRLLSSLSLFLGLFLVLGLATAGPAAAVDDPARPEARVTHGPSCRPGGVVVEVIAGSVRYSVRLATTRHPDGEDEVELAAGATAVLRTGDVAWGETIDSRLEYAALDGSGTTYVDELPTFSFTRPAEEDCAAITAPAGTDVPTSPPPSAANAPASDVVPPASASADVPESESAPAEAAGPVPSTLDAPRELPAPGPDAVAPSTGPGEARTSVRQVAPGGAVPLRGSGFQPGERVSIRLQPSGVVVGETTARSDGSVATTVRIPGAASIGITALALVGDNSTVTAGIELEVAAAGSAVGGGLPAVPVPLLSAVLALLVAAGAVVAAAGRHRALPRGRTSIGSA